MRTTLAILGFIISVAADASLRRRATEGNATTIVGGSQETNTIPYFVHFGSRACGASLINGDIVLTAAHCGKR